MRIVLLTNEYPPHVYGGAGVHMEYLSRELVRADDGEHQIDVLCFGDQDIRMGNLRVRGIGAQPDIETGDPRHASFLGTLVRDLVMSGAVPLDADVIHCHTWYSHLAGCLAKQLTGAKLVLTTHSLEPHRPWKAEQLGTAYNATTWIEQTAYHAADGIIAVSEAMKDDVINCYDVDPERVTVIPNGIDLDEYQPGADTAPLIRMGVDVEKPYVLFVGRITRQKGIIHLVNALKWLTPGTQVVLAAGAPDTPEIGEEMEAAVRKAQAETDTKIVWLREMLARPDAIALYANAAVFVCPSVYEPFGIINLEAMACETAVVASAVGGIPGIVVDGVTGLLVPFEPAEGSAEPADSEAFSKDLATAINALTANPDRARIMGRAGRLRVEEHFSWTAVAEQTLGFYREVIESR